MKTDAAPPPPALFSLKWRLVAFVSLILLSLSIPLICLGHSQLVAQFEERSDAWYEQQHGILERAVSTLGRQAGLIAASLTLNDAGGGTLEQLQRNLERQWPSLQLILDAQRLALFDADGQHLASWGAEEPRQLAPDWLQPQLSRALAEGVVTTAIHCDPSCQQYAFIPIVANGAATGVLVIGRSLAGLAQGATNDSVALVATDGFQAQAGGSSGRPNWHARLLTAAAPERMLPMLEAAAERLSLAELSDGAQRFDYDNGHYRLFAMPLNQGLGQPASGHLLVIADVSAEVRSITTDTYWLALFILAGGLITQLLLLALLWRPLQRLGQLSRRLPALAMDASPGGEPAPRQGRWPDELDLLDHAARLIGQRLESLELDLQAQRADLGKQVETLNQARNFVDRLFETGEILILSQDTAGLITRANQRTEQITGISAAMLCGRAFAEVFPATRESKSETYVPRRETALELPQPQPQPGLISWYHTPLLDLNGRAQGLISIGIDVTERRHAERRLAWLADRDPLTRLYNRHYLKQVLERMIERKSQGAVLLIDLDQFQEVNALSGHVSGDELLQYVAAALRAELDGQAVISRYRSNEFALLVEDADSARAIQIARRIEHALDAVEYYANGRRHRAIGSIGIALFPQHGTTPVELLASADLATYLAKQNHYQRWHVLNAVDATRLALQQQVDVIEQLRQALREGRFVLELQPIICLEGGPVDHYEALVRMVDDEGRLTQPGSFIPIAERFGLITEIDQWVIREGLSLLTRLDRYGIHLAVNLSAASLLDGRLLDRLAELLAASGVPAQRLTIEITETLSVTDINQASRMMKGIRALGCKTALDDFGVGFSSFHHLLHLPTDIIKIDGSFIRQLTTSHEGWQITKAITETALAFGKQVVAECVEDAATLELLAKVGVTHAQGFYIGRPLPESQLLASLSK